MFRNSSSRFILRGLTFLSFVILLLIFIADSIAVGYLGDFDHSYLPVVPRFWPVQTPTPQPGRLVINEVMYRPAGAEPAREWIEIVNAGGLPVELTGCKLGDAVWGVQDEGMMIFPGQIVVAPGQVLVVANSARAFQDVYGFQPDYEFSETDSQVPTLNKYRDWSVGNVNLGNSGDELLLLDENDLVLDAVAWGNVYFDLFNPPVPNVAQGHSIARLFAYIDTDTAADWHDVAKPSPKFADFSTPTPVPSPSLTPTATGTPPPPLPLLISEVYIQSVKTAFNPGDWIEIYNPGEKAVSLETYKVGDEESQNTGGDGGEAMYRFPDGARLQPGGVLVVAVRAQDFYAVYGFQPDYEMEDTDKRVRDMVPYNSWSTGRFYLNELGDEVLLLDVNNSVMDAVSWQNSTWAFSPPVILSGEGSSIARWPANHDTNTADDWVQQAAPDPGQVTVPKVTITPSCTTSPGEPPATTTPSPTGPASTSPPASSTATMTPTAAPEASYPLLSEVFYNPVTKRNADEWMEIYNPTGAPWDLSGYRLGDEEVFQGEEGMFRFPQGTHISPGARLVVAVAGQVFLDNYGFSPDFEVINTSASIPDLVWDRDWSNDRTISLLDNGDEVLLLDDGYKIIDVLVYGTGSYPGVSPHPGVERGHSLERLPASRDTDDCSQDFIDQAAPSPGQ